MDGLRGSLIKQSPIVKRIHIKRTQRGICPDCSGRGFFSSGFESVYIHDCDTCK